jgi:glycosyl hydrolase family 38
MLRKSRFCVLGDHVQKSGLNNYGSKIDGKALILRLYNPTTEPVTAQLTWHPQVSHVWLSNGREEQGAEALADIPVAGWDLVTLRVEP